MAFELTAHSPRAPELASMPTCLAIRVSYRKPDRSILVGAVARDTVEHGALPPVLAPDVKR